VLSETNHNSGKNSQIVGSYRFK